LPGSFEAHGCKKSVGFSFSSVLDGEQSTTRRASSLWKRVAFGNQVCYSWGTFRRSSGSSEHV